MYVCVPASVRWCVMHTFASGSCVYVCPCVRGYLPPGVTWLDSSPRLHTSKHTSACAGCMCQPGWRRGLEPGREALGGNRGHHHKIDFFFSRWFFAKALFIVDSSPVKQTKQAVLAERDSVELQSQCLCLCWHLAAARSCITFLT